jgi:hypothetical protein
MEPLPDQFVRKAEYARMRGWNRSYVAKLLKESRLVLSPDATLVDWAATDALLGVTSDPSKKGVQERWAGHRRERDVGVELDPSTARTNEMPDVLDEPPAASSGKLVRGFHYWREKREMELALVAERERKKLDCELIDAGAVKRAAEQLARDVRDRLLALPERVYMQVAFESDPLKVMHMLDAEIRDCLKLITTTVLVPQGPAQ